MELALTAGLLAALVLVALAIALTGDLLVIAMLSGIFSLTACALFVLFDATDVAFTEACVGAGISTVLIITSIRLAGRNEPVRRRPLSIPAVIVALVTGIALGYGTLGLPPFGAAENPANLHVAPYYLQNTAQDIGVANMVTAVLGSYRGYDTLGETVVVFTAALGVLLLLGGSRSRPLRRSAAPARLDRDVVLRAVALIFVPLTLLLAPYVQFHGAFSPGGGFQAGAILGGGLILYALIFGIDRLDRLVPERVLWPLAAAGVLLYGGTGGVALLGGLAFLDHDVFGPRPLGQQIGLTLIELGVFLTVGAVMTLLFKRFAGRDVPP